MPYILQYPVVAKPVTLLAYAIINTIYGGNHG